MDQSTSDAPREAAPSESCDVAATLHVCVTCLAGEDRETAPRAGRRLHDALVEAQRSRDDPPGFRIVERVAAVDNWPNVTLHQHLAQILQIATGSDMDHAGFRSGICVGMGKLCIELLCHRIDNPGAKTWLREGRI